MKIQKSLLYFILALTSLNIWNIVAFQYYMMNGNIGTILIFLSIAAVIYFSYEYLTDTHFENYYFKVVFILFMFYSVVVVLRGIPRDYESMKWALQSDFLFWPFLIPLFVFFDKSLDTLVQVFKLMYYLGIAFLLISLAHPPLVMDRNTAELFVHPFAFGSAFLLMNARYLSWKKALFSLFVCVAALLIFTYLARRNAIFTFSAFIGASLFLYARGLSMLRLVKLFPLAVFLFVIAVAFSDKIPDTITNRISVRAAEDTRSEVFQAFYDGMEGSWIFGKGMGGTYYYPLKEDVLEDGGTISAAEYRPVIENGYFQLMLSGGYFAVALFLLILLPAAWLGLFRSDNGLARACGMLIFLYLIDMLIFGLPRFLLQYIFVWISVGICYSRSFREMEEEEIIAAFKNIGLA